MATVNSIVSPLLARDPVPVTVSTSDHLLNSPSTARLQIQFGDPQPAETITFEFNDKDGVAQTVTMTARDNPDDSGNEFQTNKNGLSIGSYVDTIIVPALRANYTLFRNFLIRQTTSTSNPPNNADEIFIDGRSEFDAAWSVSNNLNGVVINFQDDGVTPEYQPNHLLVADVWMERNYKQEDYEQLVRLRKPPVDDGQGNYQAVFDISSILAIDRLHIGLPDYEATTIQEVTKPIKQAYVAVADQYGNPPELQAYTSSNTFRVFDGSIPYADRSDAGAFENLFIGPASLTNQNYFLTHLTADQPVREDEQQLLYYYAFPSTDETLDLKADVEWADGSGQTVTVISGQTIASKGLHRIPAGPLQLGLLQVSSTKTLKAYSVYLATSGGSKRTVPQRFVLERKPQPADHRFLFKNDLGVWEFIRASGKQAYNFEVSRENVALGNLGHDRQRHEFEANNTRSRNTYQAATGYVGKARLSDFQRLLRSREVYQPITDDNIEAGGYFLPVVIDPDDYELYKDDSGLFALTFNYKDAFYAV